MADRGADLLRAATDETVLKLQSSPPGDVTQGTAVTKSADAGDSKLCSRCHRIGTAKEFD